MFWQTSAIGIIQAALHERIPRLGEMTKQRAARAKAMKRLSIASNPSRAVVAALLGAAELPSADLTDAHMEHFFFCGPAAAPIALVGVELCGADALLRSLVVRPEHRSTGLGAALVEHAEAYARSHGVRAMYLLTTTAESFFARRGYATKDRASAPREIAATREFAGICPASAAFMMKRL